MLLKIKFGSVTDTEVETMLDASAASGDKTAQAIRASKRAGVYYLNQEESIYLRDAMYNDVDRVAQGQSEAAGRAFERAADKLDSELKKDN